MAERLGVNLCTALNQTAYRLLKTDAKGNNQTYQYDNYASVWKILDNINVNSEVIS